GTPCQRRRILVPASDDDQFERYLKQFQPLIPDPLPSTSRNRGWSRGWIIGVCAAVAMALLIVGVIQFRVPHSTAKGNSGQPELPVVNAPTQPLTVREANALLFTAPSYKAALNDMAFRRSGSPVQKDKQSAFAILAKEKFKL